MISTRPSIDSAALLAGVLLGLGAAAPAGGQKILDVELFVLAGDFSGRVDHSGGGFVAEHFGKGDKYDFKKNFRESADWMQVGHRYMAHDPVGRKKEVLARDRYAEDTRWEKVGSPFEMRLRVPKG